MIKINFNLIISQFICILIVSIPRCHGANNPNGRQSLGRPNVKA